MSTSIENECRRIYCETRHFPPIKELCEKDDFCFEILMGPPIHKSPVMFIGYQPGNWELSCKQARAAGYENDWVHQQSHYTVQNWLLAKRLQSIFKTNPDVLSNSVGINAIYVRAPNVLAYENAVPLSQRRIIKEFCMAQNERIIELIEPKCIIIIGFSTMNLFGGATPELVGSRNMPLTKRGFVFGRNALVVRHLTGARFTSEDRTITYSRIRDYVQSHL